MRTATNVSAAVLAGGTVGRPATGLLRRIVSDPPLDRAAQRIGAYTEADVAPLQREIAALFPAGALPANVIVPVVRLGRDGALVEIELDCVRPEP